VLASKSKIWTGGAENIKYKLYFIFAEKYIHKRKLQLIILDSIPVIRVGECSYQLFW